MAKRKSGNTIETLVNSVVKGIQEVKGSDILCLDLREVENAAADFFIICNGTSSTQVEAIARSVERETEKELGESPRYVEGLRNAKWVLMDYFNVLVHVFDAESRAYYQLEDLWSDGRMERIEERA